MLLPIPAMAQWHRIFCRLKRGDFGGVPTSPQDRNREGAEAEQGPLMCMVGPRARCKKQAMQSQASQ
jgi:hypothetical protein